MAVIKAKAPVVVKIIKISVTVLAALGMVWFFLPYFQGGFGEGAIFGEAVCLFAILMAWTCGRAKGKVGKVLMTILLVFFALFLVWAVFLTCKIAGAEHNTVAPPDAAVIVLGARVYEHGPSVSLKNRLDVAHAYLLQNPKVRCIVSGGKGDDEHKPEAHVEKEYLMGLGIAEERILVEDKSTSTEENMRYSRELAKQNNLGDALVIATQGFHQFRASALAKKHGFTPYALVADTNAMLYPAYYGREILSLTKFYLEELIGR